MKIALVVPPWALSEQYGLTLSEVGSIEEPLGLAYIAAVLESAGHRVEIIDCIAEQIDQIGFREKISRLETDLVGITALTPMIRRTFDAVKIINELKPGIPIGIGGPHVGAMIKIGEYKQLFENNGRIDFAVYGEGEYTMLEIAERMEKGEEISNVRGTIVKAKEKIILNKPRDLIEDLDSLPFPARHLLPKDKYRPTPSSYKKLPVKSVISSRGCPFNCIFCDKSVFGSKVRFRSPNNVVDEIELLIEKFGAKEIRFWDDIFTLKKKYVLNVCKEIEERKLDFVWGCFGRVNTIDKEMLLSMRKAGCWQIEYGVESGNDNVLKVIKKGFTTKQVIDAFKLTRKAGIKTRAFFILGMPTETLGTVKETIEFSKICDPDTAVFYLPQAYPGTELFDLAVKENALGTDDWSKYLIGGDEPTYVNPGIEITELKELQKKAYKKFYFRPRFILKSLNNIRSFSDLRRYVKGFFAVNHM